MTRLETRRSTANVEVLQIPCVSSKALVLFKKHVLVHSSLSSTPVCPALYSFFGTSLHPLPPQPCVYFSLSGFSVETLRRRCRRPLYSSLPPRWYAFPPSSSALAFLSCPQSAFLGARLTSLTLSWVFYIVFVKDQPNLPGRLKG